MSIIQISKIQQRSGNLVDLPQLDEAEFGWASDAKRLFIGKTTPNENIEVLTSYSQIDFNQVNGAVGNLNISAISVADGQVLTYDGSNWVNRGGDAGGLITLGDVANVKITGGAIGYVLETDGTGNLNWTPKTTVVTYIENVTQANPAVVTTTQDNFLTEAVQITITDAPGMTQLNGNSYYAKLLTANTFALYSDSALTTTVDSSGYNPYAYTSVSATTISTNVIDVGNAAVLTVDAPVRFLGDMSTSGIVNDFTYYVKTRDTLANTITISDELLPNGVAGPVVSLQTTSLTANVYQEGGRVIASTAAGGGTGVAGGSNTSVQYNNNNLLSGDADFKYDFGASPKLLTLNGNANVGNLNGTGVVTATRFISNIATGTTPLQVNSTTRVANLNVTYANVSDYGVVTAQTTGTFYPAFVNGNTTANYALGSNANLSFNVATGNLSMSLLNVTGNANVGGNIGVGNAVIAVGNVSGANLNSTGSLSVTGNANVGNIGATVGVFTGNITSLNANLGNLAKANYFQGDGGLLTNVSVSAGTSIVNGTSNVAVAVNGNVTVGVAGTANVLVVTSTSANINGNARVTGQLVLPGNASTIAALLTSAAEVATVSATAATGTVNFDVTTQSVLYYTTNAAANWTVNFRASSGTTLDTALSTGQSLTAAFLVKQGSPAYYANVHKIDGNTVTPLWQGGAAPTAGNANSTDVYTYTIIKTAANTFTMLASQTQFA